MKDCRWIFEVFKQHPYHSMLPSSAGSMLAAQHLAATVAVPGAKAAAIACRRRLPAKRDSIYNFRMRCGAPLYPAMRCGFPSANVGRLSLIITYSRSKSFYGRACGACPAPSRRVSAGLKHLERPACRDLNREAPTGVRDGSAIKSAAGIAAMVLPFARYKRIIALLS